MELRIATELCKQFEGFRAKPYLCPAGIPTIGYGSTYYADGRKVTLQDTPIDESDAEKLLLHELEKTYLPGVLRCCPGLGADEKRLNAIVDFAYNLGVGRLQTSTLRRKLNEQNWEEAAKEILRWNRAGGRVLAGLTRRREAESKLLE